MKIAVLNSIGAQITEDGKIKNYFLVSDSYDFTTNQATDVSSIENYKIFYRYSRLDLINLRSSLKANILPRWDGLSDEEKKYLISIYIYPLTLTQGDIDAFFTSEEQIDNWKYLVDTTKINRSLRWDIARQRISFLLTGLEILSLYTLTKTFKGDYVDANLPHLVLWITNGSYPAFGIDYTINGFAQQIYYTEERKNLLVDILVNGNL